MQVTATETEIDVGAATLGEIMSALTLKYPHTVIAPTTDIFGSGMADSQMFLDIILDVEGRTGLLFNADSIEIDGSMTPLKMAMAFK
jgi:hypothetical protein